jgi:Vps4 C terminal oligomerisation domain
VRNHVEMYTPCAESDLGAFPMKWTEKPPEKLLDPPVEAEDFFAVVAKSKPSVGPDEMLRYGEWTEQYGSEGA